jgi:hypothetical protein
MMQQDPVTGTSIMHEQQHSTPIPAHLHRYFWEYDPERLSLEESRHTILLRLLQSGGMDALRWLRATVSDDELRTLLVRRRGRGITPRRLRFWGLMLDVPEEQVDEWVAAERATVWNRRTH